MPYEEMRSEMEANLRTYLTEQPCVPGESNETLKIDPVARGLTQVYRRALARMASAVEAGDARNVLRHGATLGDVMRELVQQPTRLSTRFKGERIPTLLKEHESEHRERLQRFNDQYLAGDNADEKSAADLLADLLGQSYCKVLAKLESALKQGTITYVTHHTSVVADLVGEMIDLWIQRTDYFTEEVLPANHPHKKKNEEKLVDVGERVREV